MLLLVDLLISVNTFPFSADLELTVFPVLLVEFTPDTEDSLLELPFSLVLRSCAEALLLRTELVFIPVEPLTSLRATVVPEDLL